MAVKLIFLIFVIPNYTSYLGKKMGVILLTLTYLGCNDHSNPLNWSIRHTSISKVKSRSSDPSICTFKYFASLNL